MVHCGACTGIHPPSVLRVSVLGGASIASTARRDGGAALRKNAEEVRGWKGRKSCAPGTGDGCPTRRSRHLCRASAAGGQSEAEAAQARGVRSSVAELKTKNQTDVQDRSIDSRSARFQSCAASLPNLRPVPSLHRFPLQRAT